MHSVALNHNLPDMVVQDIIESAFQMTRATIESADRTTSTFQNIQLINFGKFFVSPGKLKFYTELNEKNNENQPDYERDFTGGQDIGTYPNGDHPEV